MILWKTEKNMSIESQAFTDVTLKLGKLGTQSDFLDTAV